MLRPLVNQPDIILFMATFGLTYFLVGFGELVFGGEPKVMIAEELCLPSGAIDSRCSAGFVTLQKIDIAAAVIASIMVAGARLVLPEDPHRPRAARGRRQPQGRALGRHLAQPDLGDRVVRRRHRRARDRHHVGRALDVSFALQIIALKALPVLILGGFTSIPGAIVGGLIIGIGEKIGEFYWGPLLGGGIESWLAYVIALVFLLFRPQGLFGEKIIERV